MGSVRLFGFVGGVGVGRGGVVGGGLRLWWGWLVSVVVVVLVAGLLVAVAGVGRAVAVSGGSVFVPVDPSRVFDSRSAGVGGVAAPLGAGETRLVSVGSVQGGGAVVVPSSAVAVAFNITVPSPSVGGHLRVMPGDVASTGASAVNFRPGETIANGLVTRVDAQQRIHIFNAAGGAVEAVVDVVGYFVPAVSAPQGGRLTAVTPIRVYDTAADAAGMLGVGATRSVSVASQLAGLGGAGDVVPVGATAVAYNITVVRPTAAGHVRVFPGDVASSSASSLNWTVPGDVIANGLQVRVAADRTIKVFNSSGAPVHFLIDVLGFYRPGAGADFFPVDPARVYDSRAAQPAQGVLPTGSGQVMRTVSVADGRDAAGAVTRAGVVPAGAVAVAYNLTATATTASGHLRVMPAGVALVGASAINWPGAGYTRANGLITSISADRRMSIYNGSAGPVHAIVDTLGYYAPADLIPPPVPKLQRVTASNASATVLWNRVAASDLSGYTVYSAKSSQGPWNPVRGQTALTLDRSLAGLVVSGLTNGTTYWFAVAAYDNAGNTSAKSTPLSATPIAPPPDTTPPDTPTGLIVTPVDGAASADLSWNPVSAPDLADYVVYRNNQVAAQTTGTGTRLGVIVGLGVTVFEVAARDKAGNISAKSLPVSTPNYEYCIYDLTIQEAKSGTHPGGANGFTLVDGPANFGQNGDLNAGATGPSLYLGYKWGETTRPCVTGIRALFGGRAPDPGWTVVLADANKGAGPPIYLEYSTDPALIPGVGTVETYPYEIAVTQSLGYPDFSTRWKTVTWSGTEDPADMNKGAGFYTADVYIQMKN